MLDLLDGRHLVGVLGLRDQLVDQRRDADATEEAGQREPATQRWTEVVPHHLPGARQQLDQGDEDHHATGETEAKGEQPKARRLGEEDHQAADSGGEPGK